jgi:peptide-methionine (R)-S-oxide reductase
MSEREPSGKQPDMLIDRRLLLLGAAAAATPLRAETMKQDEKSIPDFDKWQLSEKEWKERLAAEPYAVLRKEATERPWTSPLNAEKREGVYICAGCGYDLFSSAKKFDSGTGWPSFFDVLPNAVGKKTDFKLLVPRTEYHCARCGGHQGHVFNDGPSPTGLRYCNNGVALGFRPT